MKSDASRRSRTVLVVEDDSAVRQALTWTLEAEGFPVAGAGTGRRALELATAERPGMVLLDIGLPDIPGEAVAEGLRAIYDDVPILVMTANGRGAEYAALTSAVGHLSKPFELEDLVSTVKRIVAKE